MADDDHRVFSEPPAEIICEDVEVIQSLLERDSRIGLVVVCDICPAAAALVPADEGVVVYKIICICVSYVCIRAQRTAVKEQYDGIGPVLATDRNKLLLSVDLDICLFFYALYGIDEAGEPVDVSLCDEINRYYGKKNDGDYRYDHGHAGRYPDWEALARGNACLLFVLEMDADVADTHDDGCDDYENVRGIDAEEEEGQHGKRRACDRESCE